MRVFAQRIGFREEQSSEVIMIADDDPIRFLKTTKCPDMFVNHCESNSSSKCIRLS